MGAILDTILRRAPKKAEYYTVDEGAEASLKLEYIKAVLDYASADARQVYLRVTGLLAVVVIFLTQIKLDKLRGLDAEPKACLFVGVGVLIVAAFLYFVYVSKLHHTRLAIAKTMLTLKVADAAETQYEVWRKYRWTFGLGNLLVGVGLGLLGYVMVSLVY